MTNFEILLQRTEVSWDVLVLTECWLPKTYNIPTLNNYVHATTSTNSTQNEGVVIYLRDPLKGTFEEPQIDDCNCLLLKLNHETCIIGVYRPPSYKDPSNFINTMDALLAGLSNFKNILLCGDINIDISPNARTDTVTST